MTPQRERLIGLFLRSRPDLISAPIVEDIDPNNFSGPALVVARLVPAWTEPTYGERGPYAAAIHAYISDAGLTAERFSPTEDECALHRLTPGETVFIVRKPELSRP